MNLHEYQARRLFSQYNIPIAKAGEAFNSTEAIEQAKKLGGDAWLVKAQVHAGGRGKAGGVKLTRDLRELREVVDTLIGSQLVTKQSAPHGQPVNCVLVATAVDVVHELYLGAVIDRASHRLALMASRAGGIDIEEVAATAPEKIATIEIEPVLGLQDYQCRQIAFELELNNAQQKQFHGILHGLYRMFGERDLSLVEINPLAILGDGSLCALDAKVNLDDNALYRQEIRDWRDASQEDERERRAREFDLNYITLDGNIACMVNGAGLAMATMDIIKLNGGEPANFLDVGGGTTAERVTEAFKIIMSDKKVEAILVNIFGGIVRCDLIAEGIIRAVKEVGTPVPIIVRLEGTKVSEGKKLLAESGLAIITASNLAGAAKMAVDAANRTS